MIIELPKKTQMLWQIRISIIFLLISLVFAVFGGFSVYSVIFAGVFFAVAEIIGLIYITLRIKSYKIIADKDFISVNYGVIIKSYRIMPFPRIVFVSTVSTPIARLWGLTGMVFKAAGERVFLPELDKITVHYISKTLTGEKNENQN